MPTYAMILMILLVVVVVSGIATAIDIVREKRAQDAELEDLRKEHWL